MQRFHEPFTSPLTYICLSDEGRLLDQPANRHLAQPGESIGAWGVNHYGHFTTFYMSFAEGESDHFALSYGT